MTVHPAALVLADHQRLGFTRSATNPATCDCGWRGALCDYPAHLAEVLDRAGLLAPGTPPETPTTRVLAEGRQEDDMSESTTETVCRVCDHRPGVHDRNTECRHCGAYCDGTYDDDGKMLAEGWVTREVVLPKCDRDDCTEPVEARGRRFCTPHRKEHGRSLLVQLEALTMGRDL